MIRIRIIGLWKSDYRRDWVCSRRAGASFASRTRSARLLKVRIAGRRYHSTSHNKPVSTVGPENRPHLPYTKTKKELKEKRKKNDS